MATEISRHPSKYLILLFYFFLQMRYNRKDFSLRRIPSLPGTPIGCEQ